MRDYSVSTVIDGYGNHIAQVNFVIPVGNTYAGDLILWRAMATAKRKLKAEAVAKGELGKQKYFVSHNYELATGQLAWLWITRAAPLWSPLEIKLAISNLGRGANA
jgi:hypothetical protein